MYCLETFLCMPKSKKSGFTGLLAYLYDKYYRFCDKFDQNQENLNSELITTFLLYFQTKTIGSSMRYYRENVKNLSFTQVSRIVIKKPTVFIEFPEDLDQLVSVIPKR